MDIRISPDVVTARERGRPRNGIFAFLALAVATITVVLLINPATTEEYAPVCGQEEHVHTEACMETVQTLICPLEESEGHVHGEECWEMQPVLTCELEENEEHQHTEECWTLQPVLICQLPEGVVHEHTEDCIVWEESYVCGLEDDPDHVHTDECVVRTPVFICEQEAGAGHVHNDLCWLTETVCTCGLTEHVHTDDCYPQLTGDPHADVEIDLDWESTFCNVELTGNWADDLIAIARSQTGYRESELNFVTDEYNVRHGYTRYGDWNGTRYSGWNGLYVMFCLHYANVWTVPTDPVPANWMNAAIAEGFWKEELPVPGDLAFFDDNADGLADRVGIVTVVHEDGFDMISGGTGKAVEEEPVSFDSDKLAGYLALPENPDYVTLEETRHEPLPVENADSMAVTAAPDTAEDRICDPYAPVTLCAETENGITAVMEAVAGSFDYPAEELVLTITEVECGEGGEDSPYGNAVQSIDTLLATDGKKTAVARLFDISIWHKEYEEIASEPAQISDAPVEPAAENPVTEGAESVPEDGVSLADLAGTKRPDAGDMEFVGRAEEIGAEAGIEPLPDQPSVEPEPEPVADAAAEEPVPEDIPDAERPFTLVQIQPMGPVQVTVDGIGNEDWTNCRIYRINQYGEVTELTPDAFRSGSVTVTTEVN